MRSVLRQEFFLFLRFFLRNPFLRRETTMDPSCTELAPLSALGHSSIKMQVSGSARTSPFICFGAHQYPNSNMSNVLTQYLTLVDTLLRNTFSDSTARSRMGSEKQKGGGLGQQAVGQTQHPSRNCGISAKGGRGKKNIFLRFFLRNPFLRRAQSQKLIFFLRFFLRQNNTLDRELIISANN